ncbi:hypothetical protein ACFSTD_00115 [Novosphingobium colocasiae]
MLPNTAFTPLAASREKAGRVAPGFQIPKVPKFGLRSWRQANVICFDIDAVDRFEARALERIDQNAGDIIAQVAFGQPLVRRIGFLDLLKNAVAMRHQPRGFPLKLLCLHFPLLCSLDRAIEFTCPCLWRKLGVGQDEFDVADDLTQDGLEVAQRLLDDPQPQIEPVIDLLFDRFSGDQIDDVD